MKFLIELGLVAILVLVAMVFVAAWVERSDAADATTITITEDGVERTLEVDPVVQEVIQGAVNRFYAAEDALLDVQRENAGALVERNKLRHEADTCGERVAELEMQLSRALSERDELEMRGE